MTNGNNNNRMEVVRTVASVLILCLALGVIIFR